MRLETEHREGLEIVRHQHRAVRRAAHRPNRALSDPRATHTLQRLGSALVAPVLAAGEDNAQHGPDGSLFGHHFSAALGRSICWIFRRWSIATGISAIS